MHTLNDRHYFGVLDRREERLFLLKCDAIKCFYLLSCCYILSIDEQNLANPPYLYRILRMARQCKCIAATVACDSLRKLPDGYDAP